jgi:hypothetical protein
MGKWLAMFLVSMTVLAGIGFVFAQGRQGEPRVLSGPDIGFRIDGVNPAGEPVGALVVRIDGKWIEARDTATIRRAK